MIVSVRQGFVLAHPTKAVHRLDETQAFQQQLHTLLRLGQTDPAEAEWARRQLDAEGFQLLLGVMTGEERPL